MADSFVILNIFKAVVGALLFFAYPYLAYKGLGTGLGWVLPTLMAVVLVLRAVARPGGPTSRLMLGAASLIGLGVLLMQSAIAKIIPVGIYLFLCWFFGRTLRRGPSLIERFVRLDYPDFPPGITEYCRQLTWIWVIFFAANSVIVTVLAVTVSDEVWTLYTGVVVFVLMGMLMVGEYLWRHRRFPDLEIPSPRASMESMIKNGRKVWQETL